MIRLHLDTTDVSRIRFAVSPGWEAVTSLRALQATSPNGVHGRWLRAVRHRLDRVDLPLLTTLVRPQGYIPDFLVPNPARQRSSFDAMLAQLAATDPEIVTKELTHLSAHRIAQQGPGRLQRVALLQELAADPESALRRIQEALSTYWKVAVAPFWPRIRALSEADLAFRLEQLAAGGVHQLFSTLHPSLSSDGGTLDVVTYYDGHADLGHRGLVLMPCAFAWPDVIVRTADPQPALTYTPRGLGRLWETTKTPAHAPLAAVIGVTRAKLLAHLDLPMTTTQLARHLDLSAPTVNAHLKALQAAGIVDARRDGRGVLYTRTAVAEQMLDATRPGTPRSGSPA